MASEQQLERSMLDGKDREELHAIAGAMGVKGITRLRKADLVDAILAAAAGRAGGNGGAAPKTATKPAKDTGNGAADTKPKRAVRSKKASELAAGDASLAALAAEEEALAKDSADPEVVPRPLRRTVETTAGSDEHQAKTDANGSTATEPRIDPDDERASYGEGNRTGSRRRRRRGRDRGRGRRDRLRRACAARARGPRGRPGGRARSRGRPKDPHSRRLGGALDPARRAASPSSRRPRSLRA